MPVQHVIYYRELAVLLTQSTLLYSVIPTYFPDSKLILAQRWPDVIIYVGPMSENNIGPM